MVTDLPRLERTRRAAAPSGDGELLAAVAAGDEDACRRLVADHAPAVLGLAVVLCGDRSQAEDLTQQAFERAWRHAGSFDAARGSARTWLLTITRRLAIDHLRARRTTPLAPDDLAGLIAPSPADTEHAGLRGSTRERVVAALAELPEPQRRAVVLMALGGRSATEVAALEGIPVGTAKTRVRLGLQRLRSTLAEEVDHG